MRTPASGIPAQFSTSPVPADSAIHSRAYQWVWRIQSGGLLALTVMTFFPPWSHLQEYLFLSLFLIACAAAYGEKRSIVFPSALNLPIALWLGWILLSVPFAIDASYSFAEWRKAVVKVLWFYWTMLVLRNTEYDDMDGKVLASVAAGSLALCLYASLDFIDRGGTWSDRLVRARAPSSDYNWLSTYLVIALPLLIAGAFRARHLRTICAYGGAVALALLMQALSYTRAGWMALLAQSFVYGVFTRRLRILLGALTGFLLTIGLLMTLGLGRYHQDTLDPWTLHARAAVWTLMLQDIKDHPVFGVGYGTKTFMTRFGDREETVKAPGSHNLYLMTAMGSGLPALAFFLWILTAGVSECLRLARVYAGHPDTVALLIGLALMIVGMAVRNLFDVMFIGSLSCLFWLLLATGVVHARNAEVP
jgi:putative inorganic carbon (hco3(-)) transporter